MVFVVCSGVFRPVFDFWGRGPSEGVASGGVFGGLGRDPPVGAGPRVSILTLCPLVGRSSCSVVVYPAGCLWARTC